MLIAARESFAAAARRRMVRVQYLESTGTQYLNTGFVPRARVRMTLRFSGYLLSAQSGNPWFFGSRTAYQSNGFGSYYGGAAIYAAVGNLQKSTVLDKSYLQGSSVHTLTVNSMPGGGVWLDGTRRVECDNASWNNPTYPVTVLAVNLAGAIPVARVAMRLHRVTIADLTRGDVVMHDWYPVRIGGVAAVYDTIGGGLLYNEGTGDDFTIGPDVTT